MSLRVVKAGFMTTVQDQGRHGYAHIGVPPSGFMDADAAHRANQMVNNTKGTALLEVDIGGIIIEAQHPHTVAVDGAQATCEVNRKQVSCDAVIHLKRGDQLSIAPLAHGMWTYIAIHGGIDVEPLMGSRSTLTVAGIGGFHGRRLQNSDELPLNVNGHVVGRGKPLYKRPPNNTVHSLAAVKGPEFDLFLAGSQSQVFKKPFTMTEHLSRQGMQLKAPELVWSFSRELPSSGTIPGSLQVTAAGHCLISHRDSQTTGGYPRIIVLKKAALNQLAQVRPGEKIYFYLEQ